MPTCCKSLFWLSALLLIALYSACASLPLPSKEQILLHDCLIPFDVVPQARLLMPFDHVFGFEAQSCRNCGFLVLFYRTSIPPLMLLFVIVVSQFDHLADFLRLLKMKKSVYMNKRGAMIEW